MRASYKCKQRKGRTSNGGVLLLTVMLGMVLVLALVAGVWLFKYSAIQSKEQCDAEAVALGCAQELSRIVVEDPHFGYISLTDQAPGSRTVSATGDSMPVRGINTILANIRQTRIIAKDLGNSELKDLTDKEFELSRSSLKLLTKAFVEAANGGSAPKRLALDVNGKPIDLCQKARQFYDRCSSNKSLTDIKLAIDFGELAGGGPTISSAPLPEKLGAINSTQLFGSNYLSCISIPVDRMDFVFAPVSRQATLADAGSFMASSSNHLGSTVRLQVTGKTDGLLWLGATACAIPPAYKVAADYSTLMVGLPAGMQNASSFADLLRTSFSAGSPLYFKSENGDCPVDETSTLVATSGESNFSYAVNQVVYDWLRSTNTNSPDSLKSIMEAFSAPIVTPTEERLFPACYVGFFFDADSKLHKHTFFRNPFYKDFISDSQESGKNCIFFNGKLTRVTFIDNVKNIGIKNSGKHGGQSIDIGAIDGPSLLATNLEDEAAQQRSQFNSNQIVSEPLPETLKLAGEIQIEGEAIFSTENE
jgi:hypothetical protein